MSDVLALLGSVWKLVLVVLGSAGGGAAVAIAVIKRFGEKWLDARFAQRLERLKHEQSKEIEGMRRRVQWEFSRISKIHEREFEVLPKAWLMLHEAHGRTSDLVGRLKQYPDLDNMDDPMYEAFVAGTDLPDFRKQELRETPRGKRYKAYTDLIAWVELADADNAQVRLNNYLIENRIFMESRLSEAFRSVSIDLALANSNYRSHKQHGTPSAFDSGVEHFSKTEPQIRAIEAMIQERLHYEGA